MKVIAVRRPLPLFILIGAFISCGVFVVYSALANVFSSANNARWQTEVKQTADFQPQNPVPKYIRRPTTSYPGSGETAVGKDLGRLDSSKRLSAPVASVDASLGGKMINGPRLRGPENRVEKADNELLAAAYSNNNEADNEDDREDFNDEEMESSAIVKQELIGKFQKPRTNPPTHIRSVHEEKFGSRDKEEENKEKDDDEEMNLTTGNRGQAKEDNTNRGNDDRFKDFNGIDEKDAQVTGADGDQAKDSDGDQAKHRDVVGEEQVKNRAVVGGDLAKALNVKENTNYVQNIKKEGDQLIMNSTVRDNQAEDGEGDGQVRNVKTDDNEQDKLGHAREERPKDTDVDKDLVKNIQETKDQMKDAKFDVSQVRHTNASSKSIDSIAVSTRQQDDLPPSGVKAQIEPPIPPTGNQSTANPRLLPPSYIPPLKPRSILKPRFPSRRDGSSKMIEPNARTNQQSGFIQGEAKVSDEHRGPPDNRSVLGGSNQQQNSFQNQPIKLAVSPNQIRQQYHQSTVTESLHIRRNNNQRPVIQNQFQNVIRLHQSTGLPSASTVRNSNVGDSTINEPPDFPGLRNKFVGKQNPFLETGANLPLNQNSQPNNGNTKSSDYTKSVNVSKNNNLDPNQQHETRLDALKNVLDRSSQKREAPAGPSAEYNNDSTRSTLVHQGVLLKSGRLTKPKRLNESESVGIKTPQPAAKTGQKPHGANNIQQQQSATTLTTKPTATTSPSLTKRFLFRTAFYEQNRLPMKMIHPTNASQPVSNPGHRDSPTNNQQGLVEQHPSPLVRLLDAAHQQNDIQTTTLKSKTRREYQAGFDVAKEAKSATENRMDSGIRKEKGRQAGPVNRPNRNPPRVV